jgi:UDP-N-acetylmuramoylalanine--D-glutamate ligase
MANVAAATALARSYSISPAAIKSAIRAFRLDAHRMELISEKNGVTWIDDSKATNPHAAAASLNSFENIIWIVGGLLKGVDVSEVIESYAGRLKAAIVIGRERQSIIESLDKYAPGVRVIEIEQSDEIMHDAVKAALSLAETGDTVLLAPAAASMDQFKDYADRGRKFAEQVYLQLGVS